jgi:SpoVK/Ycf46/Vps4 family AAA+-type ATPase
MNDRRKQKEEEKERLMQEVLGKNRGFSFGTAEAGKKLEESIHSNETAKETFKDPDDAMSQLNQVLKAQQKELEEMSRQNGMSDNDMERLKQEIQQDYGVQVKPEQQEKAMDSRAVFDDIYNKVTSKIMGQKDALRQLMIAFRRPFVMGEEPGKAKNVILISGPKGSGKHACIKQMARSLYEKQVFTSDEVYTIDMSLYAGGAQEQIFLQDLYKALSGNGSILCFENFEVGYAPYLRMVDSLACDGKVLLNKRYILNKGQLIEAQNGLVTDTVDSLSAQGKYLVFITQNKISKVLDSFGADFMRHVLDQIELKPLDADSVKAIIEMRIGELGEKCQANLKLKTVCSPEAKDWIARHYDKEEGADSITSLISDFYICLSQEALSRTLPADAEAQIVIQDDAPAARIGEDLVSLVREKTSSKELEEINAELDEVVGLDQVKDYIRALQSHIKVQEMRRQQGMKTSEVSKHMIFTGNPGTGKTTIARLISRYMKAIGALSQGQLVEVTRADLVGQYVGHTAPLTMSVIKSALGGVLFIDEAYSLYRGKDDSFGLEAIDTLVKAMEDNRDDLIVILAGYKKEMAVFLEANSGLKSRFPNLIDFPDYTGEELTKIAQSIAKGKGYRITDDALAPLTDYFTKVQSINAAEAGNGRLARNIVEEAILKQSERLIANPKDAMDALQLADFDLTVKVKPPVDDAEAALEKLASLK